MVGLVDGNRGASQVLPSMELASSAWHPPHFVLTLRERVQVRNAGRGSRDLRRSELGTSCSRELHLVRLHLHAHVPPKCGRAAARPGGRTSPSRRRIADEVASPAGDSGQQKPC